jgi:hypothetical protein
MESVGLLDRAGRRRSRATLSGFHQGRAPRNGGHRYPPDPPPVEEIIAVMRAARDGPEAMRRRGVDHPAPACRAADQRGAGAG